MSEITRDNQAEFADEIHSKFVTLSEALPHPELKKLVYEIAGMFEVYRLNLNILLDQQVVANKNYTHINS